MDFLKAEIERKKRQLEESKLVDPKKKYFKRGELAQKQQEEYHRKHSKHLQKSPEDDKKSSKKESLEGGESSGEQPMLPRKEVIRRLRERGDPVRLFAESDYEAFQRLKKLEILEPEVNKGFRNELKAAMDQVDHEYLQEIMKSGTDKDSSASNDVKVKHVGVTFEQIQEEAKESGKGNHSLDCDVTLKFLKFLLQCWGEELNSRPADVKRSMRGKLDSATQSQTVAYLKPLFRKLKNKQISEDILDSLIKIVQFCLDRNYIKANDKYLEMAIGNAPWPIGVTMVGIHARTGREKIFDKNVAHVLNDETQRKYIQGIKRLMTKCQQFFTTAPSRSVDYDKNCQ